MNVVYYLWIVNFILASILIIGFYIELIMLPCCAVLFLLIFCKQLLFNFFSILILEIFENSLASDSDQYQYDFWTKIIRVTQVLKHFLLDILTICIAWIQEITLEVPNTIIAVFKMVAKSLGATGPYETKYLDP